MKFKDFISDDDTLNVIQDNLKQNNLYYKYNRFFKVKKKNEI